MLSYRHCFHAGNFADVLKHVVLIDILDYLARKNSPFEYFDSHAGAGLYRLDSAEAYKVGEYREGIGRLFGQSIEPLARYLEIVAGFNPDGQLRHYPGSPLIAAHCLRRQDRGWCFERHPRDADLLASNLQRWRQMRVSHEDGHKGLLAQLPPTARRGLVLMDPAYEVKEEYRQVTDTLARAHQRFSHGIFMLWYPVVKRRRVDELSRRLVDSGIRDIQLFELGITPDDDDYGMTASGVIVINPPWGLMERMQARLPLMMAAIAVAGSGHYRHEILAGE